MGTYIIAEAGVNHNGSLDIALQLADEAKKCGCDCIKYQMFQTEKLVTQHAKKAKYQVENTYSDDTQFEMLKKLELNFEQFNIIKEYCKQIDIDFMATPFDCEAVDMLEKLCVDVYKISSGDITDKRLLQYVASCGKKIILSTGMSNLEEVCEAVGWIEEKGNHNIVLLHCTSNYPTPYSDVNMKAMLTLADRFSYPVGYSDHTRGIEIPIMAVAMGATIIEKHFTLDKKMTGPDHKASLDIVELREMVSAIRNVEMAFGNGEKKIAKGECDTIKVARKSVVSKRKIKKGTILQLDDLTIKRPGTGIEPKYLKELIGRRIKRDFENDEIIKWEDVE